MNNFELIDDYLSNRLSGTDKEAFEKQLQNDPALRSDVDFQKQIINGIRQARVKEFKTMLNNIPAPAGVNINMEFAVARLAAGLITASVVGAALYFYIKPDELPDFNKAAADLNHKTEKTAPADPASNEEQIEQTPVIEEQEEDTTPSGADQEEKPAAKKVEAPVVTPAEKPSIEVTNPSDELTDASSVTETGVANKPTFSPSRVDVELDSSNKKYDFHYQFAGNKLRLFGSFDKSLYEVLEINGENHAVFLYYKDMFYLLDEKQDEITRLTEIKDAALLSRLRKYRIQ
jgi:hypothetical protein